MVEFIAELGINHGGEVALAEEMIRASKHAGADIAKFQMYNPLKILGADSPYLKEATKAQFPKIEHRHLKEVCDNCGIEYCCSVFHQEDVPFFEEIGMKRYKIASRSVKDEALLRAIKATGKPVIVSNGLDKSLGLFRSIFQPVANVSVLDCIAEYPTTLEQMKMNLPLFQFNKSVGVSFDGISSHCPSIVPSLTAVMYGARIVEHHVRFDGQGDGCDMSSSITFDQLAELIDISRRELQNSI